jgi:DNA polymerase-3 subunit gamma/tau
VPSSTSLYRRHRPRTFADVVGQEHVVRTLRNAVSSGNVHHAYLFVGSRGTGKTSMAKILAACLNCDRGPTVEPCGKCDSCVAIASATSLDVIEMDAASSNSVDDIRDLREKVAYAPVSGKHKVYILDEAHMLSPQAWNAFLKTLEEPPARTIFVLATTEAQKVLPTVVDRCHRFDFGRPSVAEVASVLARAVDAERIAVDEAAIALIARHATGSFRDALGTLEQLVTYCGSRRIEPADVLAVLGVADSEQLFDAVASVAARDPAAALRAAARLAESGRDPGQVLRDLETFARELMTVQVLGAVPPELRVTPERDQRLAAQAGSLSNSDSVRLLDLVAAALEATTNGGNARIQLELVLVKAAAPELDPSRKALLARIERLEAGLGPGRPAQTPAPPAEPAASSAPVAAAPAPVVPPAVEPVVTRVEPAAVRPGGAIDLESATEVWPAVVAAVREENGMLAALLDQTRPVGLSGGELTVQFPADHSFMKLKAEQEDYRRVANETFRAVTGSTLALRYELADPDGGPDGGAAPRQLSGDELVERFMVEFNAEELSNAREEDQS